MQRHRHEAFCVIEPLEPRQLLSVSLDNAQEIRLAYDPGGTLHLAYYDSAEHDLKYASRSPAGIWSSTTVVDNSSSNVGGELSLAVDASGNPGIAYEDAGGQKLKYAHLSGSTWSVSVVDTRNADSRPSLVFDSAGRALVGFYHPAGATVRLGQFDGKRWRNRVMAKVKSADHAGTSLAINPSDGTAAVAFQSAKGVVQYAAQMTAAHGRVGAALSARFRTGSVQALAQGDADPSVAFDASGQPGIAYYDLAHGQVMLSRAAGGTWQSAAVAPSDGHQSCPSVLFDPATGLPQVVFANAGGIFLAEGAGFQVTTIQGAGGAAAAALEPGTGTLVTVSSSNDNQTTVTSSLPAASNLIATTATSSQINLSWTDNSGGRFGYVVERAADGGDFVGVARVGPGISAFADTVLPANTHYTYRVRTVDDGGNLAYSNTADAKTLRAAPGGFFADAAFTDDPSSMVRLQWNADPGPVTGYRIQRSSDGVNFSDVATVGPDVTQYLDQGLAEDAHYTYRLMSVAADGLSDSVAAVNSEPTWLRTPTNLAATEVSSSQINLTWTNNSLVATGYRILISTDGVGFMPLPDIPDTSGHYTVTVDAQGNPIVAGHAYYFRVVATSADNASNYSDTIGVTMT